MAMLTLPSLYAILDPQQTRGRDAIVVLRQLLDGGAKVIQLRAKTLAPYDFLKLAQSMRSLTKSFGCRFIVNDRVDIALACTADGVHLGQDDLPLHAARKLMRERLIGISTHNVEQAKRAEIGGADYIGFGPMFGTSTKATGFAARGVAMLAEIRAAVQLPIVAIGGINADNIDRVWQAGADSAAIISGILHAENVTAKTREIIALRVATR